MTQGTSRLTNYLEHILEAIDRIFDYVDDISAPVFLSNKMVQDAVIRNFEIIGEASRNIERQHPDFAAANQDLPLVAAYEMRNA